MSDAKKILNVTTLLFSIMVFYCWIAVRMGYTGFVIVGELYLHPIVERMIYRILYIINIYLMFSYILNYYDSRIFKVLFSYIPIFIFSFWFQGFAWSVIFPILYSICWGIYIKNFKQILIRILNLWSVLLTYQILMLFIKYGNFYFGYNVLPIYEYLIISIDMMILLLLIYAKGGEKYVSLGMVVQYGRWTNWLYRIFSKNFVCIEYDDEDKKAIEEFRQLQEFRKLRAWSLLFIFFGIQCTIVIIVCNIFNLYIQCLTIVASFLSYKFVIKRYFHFENWYLCSFSAVVAFLILAKFSVPYTISQFFPIIVGLGLLYSLYRYSIYQDRSVKKEAREKQKRLKLIEDQIVLAWNDVDYLERQ